MQRQRRGENSGFHAGFMPVMPLKHSRGFVDSLAWASESTNNRGLLYKRLRRLYNKETTNSTPTEHWCAREERKMSRQEESRRLIDGALDGARTHNHQIHNLVLCH